MLHFLRLHEAVGIRTESHTIACPVQRGQVIAQEPSSRFKPETYKLRHSQIAFGLILADYGGLSAGTGVRGSGSSAALDGLAATGLGQQSHLLSWADRTFGQGLTTITKGESSSAYWLCLISSNQSGALFWLLNSGSRASCCAGQTALLTEAAPSIKVWHDPLPLVNPAGVQYSVCLLWSLDMHDL